MSFRFAQRVLKNIKHPLERPSDRSPTARRRQLKNLMRFEQLEDRRLLAVDVPPMKDINAIIRSSNPTEIVEMGGSVYFSATTDEFGTELWKSDGTSAGTALVKDIRVGSQPSAPTGLVNMNGTLFFRATNGTNGQELWKSDGTSSGTVMVKDINPSSDGFPQLMTNVGGTLFFIANDGVNGLELWKSDGTESGTTLVKDIRSGISGSFPAQLTNVNGTLFFSANDGSTGIELWKSNGTTEGTVQVQDIVSGATSSEPLRLTSIGSTLLFGATNAASGFELWKSDGTGATLVKDINPGANGSLIANQTNVNGVLFFTAYTAANGYQIWKSNGTEAGTVLVKSIRPFGGSGLGQLANVNGTLFFQGHDGVTGYELWKSDGTASGTVLVKDIIPGSSNSNARAMSNINGVLYFQAQTAATGYELWKSDGTSDGTVLVKDIRPGSSGSRPTLMTNLGGNAIFKADDGVTGFELWKSNGTTLGTSLVSDILFQGYSSNPRYLENVGGTLFFASNDGINGQELWKSDGTTSGTTMVADIRPGSSHSTPRYLTNVGGTLFFNASTSTGGEELWKSDGTAAGTVLVKDIQAGASGSNPIRMTAVNNTLFFVAFTSTFGQELWKSDGTDAGTVLVKDITPGAFGNSGVVNLTNVSGTLYFRAGDGTNGYELWKSDGTTAGTVMVKNIRPTSASSFPSYLTNLNGTLYFRANDGSSGDELWKSDGTEAGTVIVKDINPGSTGSRPGQVAAINGQLFFRADDGVSGYELWKSDGTNQGTVLIKDLNTPLGGSSPGPFVLAGDSIFFMALTIDHGFELWKTDGTNAGTSLVKDILPGSAGSVPQRMTALGSSIYFQANDGTNGTELWKSDGTSAGTVLVSNIASNAQNSDPNEFIRAGSKLFFTASTLTYGREVYVVEAAAGVPSSIILSSENLAEGSPIGTTVGVLSTIGSEPETTTYAIDSSAGSVPFVIQGNALRTTAVLDYETTSYYALPISATSGGVTITRVLSIFISPVNEFNPQLTSPLVYSIPENTLQVVNLSATDQDLPQPTFTYSITGGIDAAKFSMSGSQLSFLTAPDFEMAGDADGNNEYVVAVSVSDGSRSQLATLTVVVTDANDAPTDIRLSNESFPDSTPVGSVVSHLSALDVDGPLSFAFSPILPNNNADFEIVGNQLRTRRLFDYETPSDRQLLVRIVARDGLSATSVPYALTLQVTQAERPPVAEDLTLVTNQNSPTSFTISGSENPTLVYAFTQPPAQGTLSGIAPNLTYTPNPGFVGEDVFFYTITSGSLTSTEARVAITVVGVLPTVSFQLTQSQAAESTPSHFVRVDLNAPAVDDVLVPISIVPGGTASDLDYSSVGVVLIPRGESFGTLALGIFDDPIFEGQESFTLELTSSPLLNIGANTTHQVTIADNDSPPTLSLDRTSETVAEASIAVAVRVRLSAPATQDILVPYSLSTPSATSTVDFNLIGGSQFPGGGSYLRIPAGASSAALNINVIDDAIIEQTESLQIQFSDPSNSTFANPSARSFTLLIRDNDERTIVMDRSVVTVFESVGSYTLVARVDQPFTQTTTIPITVRGNATSTSVGRDYAIAEPFAFVFSANQTTATATLQVTIVDDAVPERNESIVVELVDNSATYKLGAQTQTTITIVDNDLAKLSFETAVASLWELAGSTTIRVNMVPALSEAVTIPLVLASGTGYATKGSDYVFNATSLTIPAGQTSVTTQLQIVPDAINESDELIRISFGSIPAGNLFSIGTNPSTSITIRDDDPLVSVRAVKSSVPENGIAEFELMLSAVTINPVQMLVGLYGSASLNVDYGRTIGGPISLLGPPNLNLPVSAIIPPLTKSIIYRLPIVDDTTYEQTESISVSLTLSGSPALLSTSTTATINILDNDANAVSFKTASGSISESQLNKKNRIYTATVEMAQAATRDIQVGFAFGGTAKYGVDYRILDVDAKSGLTIKRGNKTSTFRIEVISDTSFEGNETIEASIVGVTSPGVLVRPTSTRKFTILDDDSPPAAFGFRYDDEFNPTAIAQWRASLQEPNQPLVIGGVLAIGAPAPLVGFYSDVPNLTAAQLAALRDINGKALPKDIALSPGAVALVVASGSKGPVDGALAFFDINFNGLLDFIDDNDNGVLDEGEIAETPATTAADGSFAFYLDDFDADGNEVIDVTEGRLVLSGGVDISTGLEGLIPLTAPVGLFNVTPLSTLTESLVRNHAMSVLEAMDRTVQAFGIENYSLAEGVSLYQVLDNDVLASQAYSAHVQIYSVVVGIAQYLAGVSGRDVASLGSLVFDEVASFISSEGSTLDLTNAEVIFAIAQAVAIEQAITIDSTVSLNAAANAIINGVLEVQKTQLTSEAAGAGEAFLTSIYKAKKVVQGLLPADLKQLGANLQTVATIDNTYTPANIASLVANQVASVTVPPVVGIDSLGIVEGDNGQRTMVFTATLRGNHDYPVSVDFSTADGSAVATASEAVGDYQSHSGTLTWAANDNSLKYIYVSIEGDTLFEADEFFRVLLSNPSRLVIREAEGRGLIHNNESYSVTTSAASGQESNELLLSMSDGLTRLDEAGIELLNGLFVLPVQSQISGQANLPDVWTIDFSEGRYRADTWSFDGKAGAGDKMLVQAGTFSELDYSILTANSSELKLRSASLTGAVSLNSTDVESSQLLVSATDRLIVRVPSGVTSLIIEDADPTTPGVMRIRSASGEFAPIEFTNPNSVLRLVRVSASTTITVASLDSAFAGNIEQPMSDATRPVSQVTALPAKATSLSVVISVSGSDPGGSEGAASGVKEYDLFVAIDTGAFTKFATVPASSPTTTYQATSNHTYYFRSVARDNAGNVELEPALAPDTMTRTGDLDKPVTQVIYALPSTDGRFDVTMTGSDSGGSKLARFDLFVGVDGGVPTLVGSASAGIADSTGDYMAILNYQGIADGASHTYRFYSRGVDGVGNFEEAPITPDFELTRVFSAPVTVTPTGINVQQGANQRSFIRTVDIAFSSTTNMQSWFEPAYVQIQKFDISNANLSSGGTVVGGYTVAPFGDGLRIDFGASGIGGSATTIAGDGKYRIALDLDRDGDFGGEPIFDFFRLLGDANGDGRVNVNEDGLFNTLDSAVVDSLMGRIGANLDGDLNGSGNVNMTDKSYTTRQRGRKVNFGSVAT